MAPRNGTGTLCTVSRICTRVWGIDQRVGPTPNRTRDHENAGGAQSCNLEANRSATGTSLGSTGRYPPMVRLGAKRARRRSPPTPNRRGIHRSSSDVLWSLASVYHHEGLRMVLGVANRTCSGDRPSSDSGGDFVSGWVRGAPLRDSVSPRLLVGASTDRVDCGIGTIVTPKSKIDAAFSNAETAPFAQVIRAKRRQSAGNRNESWSLYSLLLHFYRSLCLSYCSQRTAETAFARSQGYWTQNGALPPPSSPANRSVLVGSCIQMFETGGTCKGPTVPIYRYGTPAWRGTRC